MPIDGLFSSFDEKPAAAASIAQVHYATTMNGEDVAVKILRPQIETAFASDLSLFKWIAKILENYISRTKRLQPVEVVQIFANTIALEMDMRMEAAAAAELAQNFEGDPDFKVPQIFWETTTKRVLTIERLSGCRPDDIASLENQKS